MILTKLRKLVLAWALLPVNIVYMYVEVIGSVIQDLGHETVWFLSQKSVNIAYY
jgi:hypothetical protein